MCRLQDDRGSKLGKFLGVTKLAHCQSADVGNSELASARLRCLLASAID